LQGLAATTPSKTAVTMRLTLKKEATKLAAGNFLRQQARFDKFIDVTTTTDLTKLSA